MIYLSRAGVIQYIMVKVSRGEQTLTEVPKYGSRAPVPDHISLQLKNNAATVI